MPSASKFVQGSSNNKTGVSEKIDCASFTLCFIPLLKYLICLWVAFSSPINAIISEMAGDANSGLNC